MVLQMFEVAARNKYRFPFKGLINVEDLWQLDVNDLDIVFKALNSELKQVKEESLLEVKSEQDKELDLKIEIVKHIVKVKLDEAALRSKLKEKKVQEQKILAIISGKQDESLQGKSLEELQAMLSELGN
jgi:hypothetical protein